MPEDRKTEEASGHYREAIKILDGECQEVPWKHQVQFPAIYEFGQNKAAQKT